MPTYLDFEQPIADLFEQLEKQQQIAEKSNVNANQPIKALERKIKDTQKEIYDNLTPWQKVQVSRHPDRPHTLGYIESITGGEFQELHGDRTVGDDKAMVGGFGALDGQTIMFIGQQKGVNTKMRQYRNFGMPNPEGYRKALRIMKQAEKFNNLIITFIYTPGSFPGLEAEVRGP